MSELKSAKRTMQILSLLSTNHEGLTLSEISDIFLIQQNSTAALEVTDRIRVLESGKVKMSGSATELTADDKATKTYLGRQYRSTHNRSAG